MMYILDNFSKAMAKAVISIFIILIPSVAWAQPSAQFTSFVEVGAFVASSQHTPFWLRANQWGQVPLASPTATARLGGVYSSPSFTTDTLKRKSRISWQLGAEAIANVGIENVFLLPEAYAKLRWKQWELMAGREKQIVGIVDTTLSSGSYSWSGNALPVPMVRFGLAEYLPFGFLGNFVSVKGTFVHGWFLDSYIKKSYLHQKSFYGLLGKPSGIFHLQVGMAHQVMWGGEADYLVDNPVAVNGKLPREFKDYVRGVVLAQIPEDGRSSRITTFDGINRIGNHLGHYDLAVDWKIRKSKFMLYRQHPFEDASGLQLRNLPDGLYGFGLRRDSSSPAAFLLKGLVLECLYTKNQSGDDFTIPGSRFSGSDGYFNHGQYIEGWSYKGLGLGTPFLPTKLEVGDKVVLNNQYFPSNRIILFHLGLEGLVAQKIRLMVKVSQSYHYLADATPIADPIYRQFSSMLSVDAPFLRWGDTRLKAQFAYDKGDVLPDSFGGYLGIKSNFRKN